jgi:hypothetical protein
MKTYPGSETLLQRWLSHMDVGRSTKCFTTFTSPHIAVGFPPHEYLRKNKEEATVLFMA